MSKIDIIDIRGALARGYCDKKNSKKTLDADLLNAQAKEITELIKEAKQEAYREIIDEIEKLKGDEFNTTAYGDGVVWACKKVLQILNNKKERNKK